MLDKIPTEDFEREMKQWEQRKEFLDYSIVEPIKEIINNRIAISQFSKNDKENVLRFANADYLKAQLLPCHHLDEHDKRYILSHFYKDLPEWDEKCQFVKFNVNLQQPQADFQTPIKQYTPCKTLLKWFTDKKSKKVQFAKKEIKERYLYLDPKDQLLIRLAFLNSSSIQDQMDGLRYCLDCWNGKELSPIQNILEKALAQKDNNRWYLASRLLIRHAKIQYVVEKGENLYVIDSKHNKKLYYYLALRLHSHRGFEPQKKLLRIKDYYALLYHTNQPISGEEWEEDIYRMVAEIYIHNSRFTPLPYRICKDNTELQTSSNCIYPQRIPIPEKERKSWNNELFRNIKLIELSPIRELLMCASFAELKNVKSFVQYAEEVDNAILKKYGTTFCTSYDSSEWEQTIPWEEIVLKNQHVVCEADDELILHCPQKYKHLFEEIITEHNEEMAKLRETYDAKRKAAEEKLKSNLYVKQLIDKLELEDSVLVQSRATEE